jgi:hypothetical protein
MDIKRLKPLRNGERKDRSQSSEPRSSADSGSTEKVTQPETTPRALAPAKRSDSAPPPHFADDLIRRVIVTIDEWAVANGLANLPRKVVFEQALAIMTALYENSSDGKR